MSMSKPAFEGGLNDLDDVAAHVVDRWADRNQGVAEVIPADEVEEMLRDVVVTPENYTDEEWEALLLDTKSAVTDCDVIVV